MGLSLDESKPVNPRNRHRIWWIIDGGIIAAVLLMVIAVALSRDAQADPATLSIPPCVFEDGSGGPTPCYWDGSTMGNGTGSSYIVTEDEAVMPIDIGLITGGR